MDFYDSLNWRYATKKMNGKVVSEEKIDRIFSAIQLAPTSLGAQPFTVFVVTDKDVKEEILPIANGQTQITDSSHVLVFAAWDRITDEQIEEYVQHTARERNLDIKELAPFRKYLKGVAAKPEKEFFDWSARQTYIALGFGLAAAAVEEVDSTPMEGFDPQALDNLLGLREKGMRSVSLLALGYRDGENDWLAPMKKIRRPKSELFVKPEIGELV